MTPEVQVLAAWDPAAPARTVTSVDELTALLYRLDHEFRATRQPTLLLLQRDGEQTSLGVGLGHHQAMLSWLDNGEPPADQVSQGDPRTAEARVAFQFAGTESEYPASVLIDPALARQAAIEYARNGRKPTAIAWQEL